MANVDRPRGFHPVKHLDGSPWNGQTNTYYIFATYGTALFVGDVVKLAGSADANGVPSIEAAGTTDVPVGIIVRIKPNPDSLNQIHNTLSTEAYAEVCDAPDVVMEAQIDGAIAVTDIGMNCPHNGGSGDTTTGLSGMELDYSNLATTSTDMFQVIGLVPSEDNAIGDNANCLCRFNVHQYGSVGTVGI